MTQTDERTFTWVAVSTLAMAGTAVAVIFFVITSLWGQVATSGVSGVSATLQLLN